MPTDGDVGPPHADSVVAQELAACSLHWGSCCWCIGFGYPGQVRCGQCVMGCHDLSEYTHSFGALNLHLLSAHLRQRQACILERGLNWSQYYRTLLLASFHESCRPSINVRHLHSHLLPNHDSACSLWTLPVPIPPSHFCGVWLGLLRVHDRSSTARALHRVPCELCRLWTAWKSDQSQSLPHRRHHGVWCGCHLNYAVECDDEFHVHSRACASSA
mmetsp:Transcript_81353/g.143570  ORF Transcript_81353/g.143570 Transcript_81353/m.143570 type:complete len:216 (+) Transcript_81353:1694-2341(+)